MQRAGNASSAHENAVIVVGVAPGALARGGSPKKSPAEVFLNRISAGSKPAMEGCLNRILSEVVKLLPPGAVAPSVFTFDWSLLRYEHTSAVAAALRTQMAPATYNKHLTALRQVMKETWRLGYITADERDRATDLESAKTDDGSVAGRALAPAEIQALVDACDQSRIGRRDAAVVMVLALAGLRRAELCGLNQDDYDGASLVFRGKRNKRRRVSVATVAPYINAWLEVYGMWVPSPTNTADPAPADPAPAPLFVSERGARLSTKGLWAILQKLQTAAGVSAFTPHDMRRGFITNLLASGEDVLTVARMAGHDSPSTTKRYDRRGDALADAAIARQIVPTRRLGNTAK